MDYLILGGYGYLGSRIVDFLIGKGNITIGTSKKKSNNFSFKTIIGYREISDFELDDLTNNYDVIIDASGISGPEIIKNEIDNILKINTIWPVRLSRSCIKNNCKLIFFSTFHCESIFINNEKTLNEKIYPLSKSLAEIAIKNLNGWDQNISILRLGNMIGSPGTTYLGNSKLLPLDISRNLVMKGKANIKSDPSNKIGYIPISKLINSFINLSPGFHKLYSKEKISIFELTRQINICYEEITSLKGNLNIKQNLVDSETASISKEIIKEIKSTLNYFLKYKNSNKNFKTDFKK